jgi:hypothetical protein
MHFLPAHPTRRLLTVGFLINGTDYRRAAF